MVQNDRHAQRVDLPVARYALQLVPPAIDHRDLASRDCVAHGIRHEHFSPSPAAAAFDANDDLYDCPVATPR